jgi:hypothetical protein
MGYVSRMQPRHACVVIASAALALTAPALAGIANYNVAGLSGNAPQWNGTGSSDTTALPATRGTGLGTGGGLDQVTAINVATTPTLDLANNDYVRFGVTLGPSPSAEYVITGFRATVGSFGTGSTGMHYQLWAAINDQPLVALTSPTPMNAPATPTSITFNAFTNLFILPGDTAEVRVYFWGASLAQNGIAFIDDGNASQPDVEIIGLPIPAPAAAALLAACAFTARRRRR